MSARRSASSIEKAVLLSVCAAAMLGAFLGLVVRPPTGYPSPAQKALDLVRVITTATLAVVLVLGPGVVLRARSARRRMDLGFLPLPGLALLTVTGGLVWVLARDISPRVVCAAVLLPVLGWLFVGVLRAGEAEMLTAAERYALLIVGMALGIAIARSLWSLGPAGELFAGTNTRTLEVGDRSDVNISYHVVQLVANGTPPFSALSRQYFAPYTFSDRGPLAGLASAPIVLLSGGRPPAAFVFPPWLPFDPQGFMSYRLAMMTFASTSFLALWTLTRRLGGEKAARFAVLLAATTPFLVHEIWFVWPKLLAAALVLLAAVSLLNRRPIVAGLLAGAGYLVHPLALLSVPALFLLALWPLTEGPNGDGTEPRGWWPRAGFRVPRPRLRPALLLLGGIALAPIGWRLAMGSHYTQGGFFDYLKQAGMTNTLHAVYIQMHGGHPPPVTLGLWLSDRLVSIGNTLVPLRLFLFSPHDMDINVINPACFPFCAGNSPPIIHFFFQYWTGVPFGLAIIFFPMLLTSLWRAVRRWPWGVTLSVIVPFVLFAVYWGSASTGMLNDGLHVWVLTLIVVVALDQQHQHFAWLSKSPLRALLALRSAEVLLVAMLPTIATRHRIYGPAFRFSDIVAVGAMVGLCGCLGMAVWRQRVPDDLPPAVKHSESLLEDETAARL